MRITKLFVVASIIILLAGVATAGPTIFGYNLGLWANAEEAVPEGGMIDNAPPVEEKPLGVKPNIDIDLDPTKNAKLKELGIDNLDISDMNNDGSFHIYKENVFNKDLVINLPTEYTKEEIEVLRNAKIKEEIENYYKVLESRGIINPPIEDTPSDILPKGGVVKIK